MSKFLAQLRTGMHAEATDPFWTQRGLFILLLLLSFVTVLKGRRGKWKKKNSYFSLFCRWTEKKKYQREMDLVVFIMFTLICCWNWPLKIEIYQQGTMYNIRMHERQWWKWGGNVAAYRYDFCVLFCFLHLCWSCQILLGEFILFVLLKN